VITAVAQRWRERRGVYRPADEVINTSHYEVAEIPGDTIARAFVETHHYSASYPAARFRFGLYRAGSLVGVAVFSHPTNDRLLSIFPGERLQSVELGRFVLLDDVPGNGETWMLARCWELLRKRDMVGVLSFSDPMPRESIDGHHVFAGHIGGIYQGHNATYLGRGTSRRLRLLPDGTVMSDRAISKIRSLERGWKYSCALLEKHGATAYQGPLFEPSDVWLNYWLPKLTRPLRHPGNHKYAWVLNRRDRRHVDRHWTALPYPKFSYTE